MSREHFWRRRDLTHPLKEFTHKYGLDFTTCFWRPGNAPNHIFSCRRKGAARPFRPGVCLKPRGGGAVIGLCHADVALGGALDSTGALWHPSPKGDKFGVVDILREQSNKKAPEECFGCFWVL